MRKLKTADVFSAIRLVKESGMRKEVQRIALLMRENKKLKIEEVGADFVFGIMEGLSSIGAEMKAYEFLSGPLEMDPESIKEIHPLEWKKIIEEYKEIEDAEAWKSFFEFVASHLK